MISEGLIDAPAFRVQEVSDEQIDEEKQRLGYRATMKNGKIEYEETESLREMKNKTQLKERILQAKSLEEIKSLLVELL